MEMLLRSDVDQRVRVDALDLEVEFAAGEEMRTEISDKFRRRRPASGARHSGVRARPLVGGSGGRLRSLTFVLGSRVTRVVILGGGSAGEAFVGALSRLDGDFETTLVERALVGGECTYWACMPSKTLLRAPEVLAAASQAPGAAEAAVGALDLERIFWWRDQVVESYDDGGHGTWLAERGTALVRGDATVAAPGVLEVEGGSSRTTSSSSLRAPVRRCRRSTGSRTHPTGRPRTLRPQASSPGRWWSSEVEHRVSSSRSSTSGSARR